jgi:hypothetical protein
MLLTKELEILQTTSSKCLLEGKKHGKEEEEEEEKKKEEEKGKNRVPNMSSQGKKAVAMGCGSCYSRTTTEMCCRLKERDGMLLRAKKE